MNVVADTSFVSSLLKANALELIVKLFKTKHILIADAVFSELIVSGRSCQEFTSYYEKQEFNITIVSCVDKEYGFSLETKAETSPEKTQIYSRTFSDNVSETDVEPTQEVLQSLLG